MSFLFYGSASSSPAPGPLPGGPPAVTSRGSLRMDPTRGGGGGGGGGGGRK